MYNGFQFGFFEGLIVAVWDFNDFPVCVSMCVYGSHVLSSSPFVCFALLYVWLVSCLFSKGRETASIKLDRWVEDVVSGR